jgi:predicted O-methyltransferase YrrM
MVKYDLSHLTQHDNQRVFGPIQDDEALFLYSIIRGNRLSRIFEIGGLSGYSGKNFLQAMSFDNKGILYTCDINPVPQLADNHKILIKDARKITPSDLDNQPLDLIFFDCHDLVQKDVYNNFKTAGIITNSTILALHDTNLHYAPFNTRGKYISEEDGYAHQPVEREMTNYFKTEGYDIFSISTDKSKHSNMFPFRHGLTVCRKFTPYSL